MQRKTSGRGDPGDQEGAASGGSLRVLGTDRDGASVWLQSALRLGAAGAAGEKISGGIRILADFPRWGMETGPFPEHAESFFAPTPLNRRPRYNNRRTSYTEGLPRVREPACANQDGVRPPPLSRKKAGEKIPIKNRLDAQGGDVVGVQRHLRRAAKRRDGAAVDANGVGRGGAARLEGVRGVAQPDRRRNAKATQAVAQPAGHHRRRGSGRAGGGEPGRGRATSGAQLDDEASEENMGEVGVGAGVPRQGAREQTGGHLRLLTSHLVVGGAVDTGVDVTEREAGDVTRSTHPPKLHYHCRQVPPPGGR